MTGIKKQFIPPLRHASVYFGAWLPWLLLSVLPIAGLLSSCLDETLISTTYGTEPDETDMYLNVSISRAYNSAGAPTDKENAVSTLDVLVFRQGAGATATGSSYYVHAACEGKLTEKGNTFQVMMPVGKDFTIHVFANCHDEMVARGFYSSKGREMSTLLKELTSGTGINPNDGSTLPMHGYTTGVEVSESQTNRTISIPVIRSVTAVQVMTNATQSGSDPDNPILTPGEVTDGKGNKTFDMHEFYVYFYPDAGRMAAAHEAYRPLGSGDKDETRNVSAASLPDAFSVSDTRQDATAFPDNPRPYSLLSPTAVNQLGNLYLYENKPWSDTGFDQPDASHPAATTRLVVGGVYNGETTVDPGSGATVPKVTYYRVDFPDAAGKLGEILRNHKYTFNIQTVSGPGYNTPDEAATGVPINIYVEVIKWANSVVHVDFDAQNYFYSATKSVTLPREAGATRTIAVESDVEASKWLMAFGSNANGATTPAATPTAGATLKNSRYKVEKAADGKSLTFTTLKTYGNLNTGAGESRNETLVVKAKNLSITYTLTQEDTSPNDWGNGGNLDTELGKGI